MSANRLSAVSLVLFLCTTSVIAQSIRITSVPPHGVWNGYLAGTVEGVNPSAYSVVVYIYVPGAGWYPKPYFSPVCTTIQPDSTWSALVTTGGADDEATIFAAFLVPTTSCSDAGLLVEGDECLPDRVNEVALDSDYALRPNPDQRRVSFSGREWLVKSCVERCGPGANYFSDSPDNVWVDTNGRLHLKITYADAKWQCAEVICTQPLGYGTYLFNIESSVDDLDPNIVLGLFTYSEECQFPQAPAWINTGKLTWSSPDGAAPQAHSNAQFVVQPYDCAGHRTQFTIPSGSSSHFFSWWPDVVQFQSEVGNTVQRWVFSNSAEIPLPNLEQTRMNLWLLTSTTPTDAQEREVVISGFDYLRPLTNCSIPTMKAQADFTPVNTQGAAVSAAFDNFFYIEADNRACGIRVDKEDHGLSIGMRADVTGTIQTNSDGERFISAAAAAQNGTGSVRPLGITNRGLEEGGLSTVGLLVTLWGRVTEIEQAASPTWFSINDGSAADIKCLVPDGVNIDPDWDFVTVTGASSCEMVSGGRLPLVRVRNQDDIVSY